MNQLQENNRIPKSDKEGEKNRIIQWIKAHKKELIIAGISISAVILIIIGIKNRKKIQDLWNELENLVSASVSKTAPDCVEVALETPGKVCRDISGSGAASVPFEVSRHIRNLPEGYHASAEKIVTALSHGIELEEGQTWVCSYWKGIDVA